MNSQQPRAVSEDAGEEPVLWGEHTESIDRAALTAFVHTVEAAELEAAEAESVAAAKQLVQVVLDAEAAEGTSVAVDAIESTDEPLFQPIDHDQLPQGVALSDAETAYDAVLEQLIAAGPATKSALIAAIHADHSLGVDEAVWWTQVIEPALAADDTVSHREAGYLLGGW